MQSAITATFLFLVGLVLLLILGPVVAGIFALVAALVLLVFALPVLLLLSPWLVIAGIVYLLM